jgi:hypothetical protein
MSEVVTAGRWWRQWSLTVPICAVGLASVLQGGGAMRETAKPREPHLVQAITAPIPGWIGRDLPLGPTEFVANEVEKVLNYDEVVNREYVRGSENFGLYAAYWGPGKMPTRFVASHTPDRCWTENGMRCVEMKFKQVIPFTDGTLQPAEWRRFEPARGDRPIYVVYWHLVEGRIYDYGSRFNAVPSPSLWLKDAVQQALLGSREQYFVRLTSSEPLEDLWNDPGFSEILARLGRLGLAVPQKSGHP